MTNPEIIDAYWGGWETCVSELVRRFETVKTATLEDSKAANNPEGAKVFITYIDESIALIQDFSTMREQVTATMKEEQQTEQ